VDFHLDNAPADGCKWQAIPEGKANKAVHPVYSRDIIRNNFVLFGRSNGK
jgi:hypothetical protein